MQARPHFSSCTRHKLGSMITKVLLLPRPFLTRCRKITVILTLEMLYLRDAYTINRSIWMVGELCAAFAGTDLPDAFTLPQHIFRAKVYYLVGSIRCVQNTTQCGRWLSRSREPRTHLVHCYNVNGRVRFSGSLSVETDAKLHATLMDISRVRRTANFGVKHPGLASAKKPQYLRCFCGVADAISTR